MDNKQAVYAELVSLRNRLQGRFEQLRRQLLEVERQLESVNTTLILFGHRSTGNGASGLDVSTLRDKTQIEALIAIAKANGNRLHTLDAKKLLLRAGKIKTPKNANNIMFTAISRSARFRKVEPGVYELISGNGVVQSELLIPETTGANK
jgi:hypothetical protein